MLARKRLWNPKYPICIQLAVGSQPGERGGSTENLDEEQGAEQSPNLKQNSSKPTRDPQAALYLFGRTGREKEEWFRHFLFASMEAEHDKKPGRCISQSGRKNVRNALAKRRDDIHIKYYICMDYGLHAPDFGFFAFLIQSLSGDLRSDGSKLCRQGSFYFSATEDTLAVAFESCFSLQI